MNDLFFIKYEAKRMLVDSMDMTPEVELAHRRLCDFIWAMAEPPLDDPETLQFITKSNPDNYKRVRAGLERKGWHSVDGRFTHNGAVKTLDETKAFYSRQSAAARAGAVARSSRKSAKAQPDTQPEASHRSSQTPADDQPECQPESSQSTNQTSAGNEPPCQPEGSRIASRNAANHSHSHSHSNNQNNSQSQKEEVGSTAVAVPATTELESWISELQADQAYRHVDVQSEYRKMVRWCEVNRKHPSRRRFINWLNRIERPIGDPLTPAAVGAGADTRDF